MDNGAEYYLRFLGGDDFGIIEIIKEYKDGLMLFLNRYVNSIHIAEELAEDTFVVLATKKPRFSPKYSFKTWLYTIGRNAAVNYLKQNNRISAVSPDELEKTLCDEINLEQDYLKEEQKIIIHRSLSKINGDYSKVLYLKFFEEMTNAQIAKIMKKSARQTENLIYHAKKALKTELNKEGLNYENLY